MLQAIRDRAHGIFAWVMLILVGVPFVLWGIQNYLGTEKEKPAAVVGDREIVDREVSRAYEQSLATLVGVEQVDEKALRREALEQLIRNEIKAQTAERRNFAVSDDDVRAFIQSLPYFQTDGKFDKEKYKIMLSSQGMNSNEFTAQVRRGLLMQQFELGIVASAFVTKDQIDTLLRLKDQERDIEYVTVPLKASDQSFSEAEIEGYYREHLDDFRTPERVSIQYLVLSLDDIAKQIKPTEEDLRSLYQEQKASFTTEERRKVSHILIPVEATSADAVAVAKIKEIRARLVTGEDFAKVAREASGDPVSAKKGGDLGVMTRSAMEPNFAQAAFVLKPGELSEPVKTSFGYHLIKVAEVIPAVIKPYDQVRDDLLKTFQRNAAENKFYELGHTLTEQAFEHPDSLETAARALGLKVEETGLFTRDAGEGLAAEAKVREAAFSEDVIGGRNSDPIELENQKAIVLRVKEHQIASDRPLDDVRDGIVSKLRTEAARLAARRQAEDVVNQVRKGRSLTDAAKGAGLAVEARSALHRHAENMSQALNEAVFKAPRPRDGHPTAALVELEDGKQAVFSLRAVKDGDPAKADQKDRDSARDFLTRITGQQEFSALLSQLRALADVHIRPES